MTPFLPVLLITPILLLLSLGIVGFVLRYQKRLIAHQQHLRALQEARQRQVLEATLEAQETERRRVARDLHDDVGTMMALVKLQVSQLCHTASGDAAATGQNIKRQLDEVIGSIRRISHDLMPVMLEKFGLVPALKSLKQNIPPGSGITLELILNQEAQRLAPQQELAAYRVVQELLNNTLKHADATVVTLSVQFAPEQLVLTYTDNGKGFSIKEKAADQKQAKAGLGLLNLQSRIELLQGTFEVTTSEGSGFKAVIVLPIL